MKISCKFLVLGLIFITTNILYANEQDDSSYCNAWSDYIKSMHRDEKPESTNLKATGLDVDRVDEFYFTPEWKMIPKNLPKNIESELNNRQLRSYKSNLEIIKKYNSNSDNAKMNDAVANTKVINAFVDIKDMVTRQGLKKKKCFDSYVEFSMNEMRALEKENLMMQHALAKKGVNSLEFQNANLQKAVAMYQDQVKGLMIEKSEAQSLLSKCTYNSSISESEKKDINKNVSEFKNWKPIVDEMKKSLK